MSRDAESTKQHFLSAYDEHADSIYRFCLARTSREALAEDLVQEVFMRFWQSLRDGKDMTNTRAFLYTIAHNLIVDWYRSHKDRHASLDALAEEKGFEASDTHAVSAEQYAEFREALDGLDGLSDDHREVIVLRFMEGLGPQDIAKRLGVSANVASVRIYRAIDALRNILAIDG